MTSVPQLATALHHALIEVPTTIERSSGYCQRQSKFTAATFVQTLVLGWLANPSASLFELSTLAAERGVAISPQGLDQRFTAESAALLKGVLEAMVQEAIASDPVPVPLLRRFPAVVVLDSTTIRLPDALADIWAGCGGRVATHTQSALKVAVRWDLVTGQVDGPYLSAGRVQDRATTIQHQPMPRGGIRIGDLGFWSLAVFAELREQSAYFLSRLPVQTVLYAPGNPERMELMDWVSTLVEDEAECAVELGIQHRLPARLLAIRVPEVVAEERRTKTCAAAQREGEPPSARGLERADWTLLVTNVPADQLTLREAMALIRARWQIELLFKLWKDEAQLDTWQTTKTDRIHCEVLAKLIAVVVAHWIELTGSWQHDDHSLVRAFKTIRLHIVQLLPVLNRRRALIAALRVLANTLAHTGHLTKRRRKPSSVQILSNPTDLAVA